MRDFDDKINNDGIDSKLHKAKASAAEQIWETAISEILMSAKKASLDFDKFQRQGAKKLSGTQILQDKEVF